MLVVERLLQSEPEWDALAIRRQYQHGFDFALLRQVIKGSVGNLVAAERAALHVVACGGFWPEERRWLAGLSRQGTCEACYEAIGTTQHRLYCCAP